MQEAGGILLWFAAGFGLLLLIIAVIGVIWVIWPSRTQFYFYFEGEADSQGLINYLKRHRFHIESRLSADEQQWLVLAIKSVGQLHLMKLDHEFELLAPKHGSEYDGYERAV